METEHRPRVFGSLIDQPDSNVLPTKAVKLIIGGKGDQLPLPTQSSRRGLLGPDKENLVPGPGLLGHDKENLVAQRGVVAQRKENLVSTFGSLMIQEKQKADSSDHDERCLAAVRSMMRRKEKLREKARRKSEKEQRKLEEERRKSEEERRNIKNVRRNLEIDKLHQEGLPNWAETPTPALSIIFNLLGAAEFCASAQAVCRSWRRLPLTSPLPPSIDMRSLSTTRYPLNRAKLANRAVDSTGGPIQQLHVQGVSEAFLNHIVDRTHNLICCSLIACTSISTKALIDFLMRCPQLEELNIYRGAFRQEIYLHIGKACPTLKRISFNRSYNSATYISDSDADYRNHKKFIKWGGNFDSDPSDPDSDEDPDPDPISCSDGFPSLGDSRALKIANNLPHLRELSITRDLTITNQGVHTILDNCLDLECLDLRCCYNIRVDPLLHTKLQKVKNVRLSRRSVRVLNNRSGKRFYL